MEQKQNKAESDGDCWCDRVVGEKVKVKFTWCVKWEGGQWSGG